MTFNAYSQSNVKIIGVQNNQVQVSKGNVVVDLDILLNGVEVTTNNQLVLTPVIRTETGQIRELPSVVVNGNKHNNLYKRSLSLNGLKSDPNVYQVVHAKKKNAFDKISYKASTPFEPWMKNASLYLVEDLCGCGGTGKEFFAKLIADRIGVQGPAFSDYIPAVNFIIPPKENTKERAEIGEAYLVYEQSKWDILPNLFDNKVELAKIERSLDYVKEEPTAVITGVSIKAYASPEGKYEDNIELSKKRAKSLLDYVRKNYSFPAGIAVYSEGFGEDWDRLIGLVEADSKLENKEQILHIIHSVGIFDGREKQLMDLSGGRPYLYMLDKLFPRLRRSDYQIEYTVPTFTLERGKELLKTKPEMVSLSEMYLIANTYEKGSDAYNEIFEIALEEYPRDVTANVNAASVAITKNNYESAKKILEKYKNEPAAWNNLGIVYMHERRLEDAENYLQKAKTHGIAEARHNLEILNELKDATKEYEREKAKYESY
jgi:tetratricopeptide (TPR) repeat protein